MYQAIWTYGKTRLATNGATLNRTCSTTWIFVQSLGTTNLQESVKHWFMGWEYPSESFYSRIIQHGSTTASRTFQMFLG